MPEATRSPCLLTVRSARRTSLGVIRVSRAGAALADLPEGRPGADCKPSLPVPGARRAAFAHRRASGPRPVRRNHRLRPHRPGVSQTDINVVDHGNAGPASARWRAAGLGAFLGSSGPGPVKVPAFHADTQFFAADLAALPMAAATLDACPQDVRSVALFGIPTMADWQEIPATAGIAPRWRVHPDPLVSSREACALARDIDGSAAGREQVCAAGEHGAIAALRVCFPGARALNRADGCISGDGSIGLVEEAHQAFKRGEAAA